MNKKVFEKPLYRLNDIHMHVIPEVDDGAWNMEMAEQMIWMSYQQGVRKLAATSHNSAFEEDETLAKENFEALKIQVQNRYEDLELYLGCEIRCTPHAMNHILEMLHTGAYPSMNGTPYVLTEFSPYVKPEEAVFCVQALLARRWIPIIAHVERYPGLFQEEALKEKTLEDDLKEEISREDILEKLLDMGCLFQINVYSVYEEKDEKIRGRANELLKKKQVHFLGSDAHRTWHRPPCVEKGMAYLYQIYDKAYIDAIAFQNADALLFDCFNDSSNTL